MYFTNALHALHSSLPPTSNALHLYFTVATVNFTTTSHVLHCCFTNLRNNFTCASLLLTHFTFISLLLLLHFTTTSYVSNITCISLVLHCCHISFTTPSHVLHYCFTWTPLALHSIFTALSHAFLHSTSQQLHFYFSNASLNFTWKSQHFHMYFTTASLAINSVLTVTSHALLLYFTVASLYFTTTSHVLHYCFTATSHVLYYCFTATTATSHLKQPSCMDAKVRQHRSLTMKPTKTNGKKSARKKRRPNKWFNAYAENWHGVSTTKLTSTVNNSTLCIREL